MAKQETPKQNSKKLDARAAALRENLKKRKALMKEKKKQAADK